MTLATVTPRDIWTNPFEAVQRDMERFFGPNGDIQPLHRVPPIMPCDITETQNTYEIEADLPGFERDDITVDINDGVLLIAAEREEKLKGKRHVSERRYDSVHRQFTLPGGVEPDGVEAKLKNGVLHLSIRKSNSGKAHRVNIK